MAQSSLDKQLDMAIGNLVIVIGKILKSVWYGCKKLRGKKIMPFMLCIILAVIGWMQWEQIASILDVLNMPGWMQKILYILILLSPAIDLALLGSVITRKQMEFSQEMEKEYRSVRKWNHDMENHLFSLNYLINTKKYDEAEKYLESLLSDLPPEKRNL